MPFKWEENLMPTYGVWGTSPRSARKGGRTPRTNTEKPVPDFILPPIKDAAKPSKKEPLPRLTLAKAKILAMPEHASHFQRVPGGWRPLPPTLAEGGLACSCKAQLVSVAPTGLIGGCAQRRSVVRQSLKKQLMSTHIVVPSLDSAFYEADDDKEKASPEKDAFRPGNNVLPLRTREEAERLTDAEKKEDVGDRRRNSSKDGLQQTPKPEVSVRNGSKSSQFSKERSPSKEREGRILERQMTSSNVERKSSKDMIPTLAPSEADGESVAHEGSKEPVASPTMPNEDVDEANSPLIRKTTKREEAAAQIKEVAKENLGRGLYELGFTEQELEQFFWYFAMFDQDHGCTMSVNELRSLLRYLGETVTPQRIYNLLISYDQDKSGEIDICEFLNFMQDFRESEQELMTGAFHSFDHDHSGEISIAELNELLSSLGREPTTEQMKLLLKDFDSDRSGTISLEEFIILGKHYTDMERKQVIKNAGFTEEEIVDFRAVFAFCDADRSGHLSFKELIHVLELVGNLPRTKEQQDRLIEMMHHYDEDDSGQLNFEEFLHLMRKFMDEDDCIEYMREKAAMDRIGLSMLEVQEFRDIFEQMRTQVGTGDDDFTFSSARTFVRSLGITLDMEQNTKLKNIFQKYASKIGPPEMMETMESQQPAYFSLLFPDFLLFVGQLITEDFAGVRSSSLKVVANRESEEQKLSALVNEVQRQKEAAEADKEKKRTKSQVLDNSSKPNAVDLN